MSISVRADPAAVGLVSAYDLSVPGGVGAQVIGLARWLHGRGHRVAVLAPGRPIEVLAGVWSTSAGRVIAVRSNGSVARIAPVVSHRLVSAWCGAVDVVHLHEPLAPGLPQAVLLRSPRPVVATVHAQADTLAIRIAGPFLRRRLARAAVLSAVSEHARQTLVSHVGLDARVVGNGIDVPQIQPPQPSGGDAIVLAVARLAEPRKGIDVLLAAWPAVRRSHPTARLLLVGPGRPRSGGAGALEGGVELVGRVSDSRRTALLDQAALVVAPHRGGESFGLVVAEAMARGRCVVASALPAFVDLLGERVDGSRAGITVPHGQPAALADALGKALTDPDLRRELGEEGWRRSTRLSWSTVGAAWLDAYRAALALSGDSRDGRLIP